jgi:S1-C subfamily serine protease
VRIEFTDGPQKGKSLDINKDRVVIGREDGADLTLKDDEVSRRHAELTVSDGTVEIEDLGSRNGTKVGGSRVSGSQPVTESDEVTVGTSTFKVLADSRVGDTRGAGRTRVAGGTAGGTRMAGSVPAMLEVVSGPDQGKTADVSGGGITIGRDGGADLSLGDDEASSEHVEVRANPDGSLEVRDLGSRNGTTVNGKKITRTTNVSDGDEIGIGRSRIKVSSLTKGTARRTRTAVGGNRRVWGIAAAVAGVAVLAIVLIVALGGGDDSSDEATPLATSEIVNKVDGSTVQIVGRLGGGRTIPLGTGWVYDAAKGLIVTNAHVVSCCNEEGEIIPVNSYAVSIDNFARRADIYAVAPCDDLAILRTAGLDAANMELGSQGDLEAGDKAIVYGYPANFTLDQEAQVTEGTVSVPTGRSEALDDPDAPLSENVVQTDAPINGGNSGGPVLNDRGQLIGVATFSNISPGAEGQHYAIGVDHAKEVLAQMANGDSREWSGFGFQGTGAGLVVLNVIPNTGSDNAGMSDFIGAPITAISGRPVATREDYCNAVENVTSGESAPVELFGGAAAGRIVFE